MASHDLIVIGTGSAASQVGAQPTPLGFPGENHLITSEGHMVG